MQLTPFHIGIIARPDYNPPGLESLFVPRLQTLILQKSLTHRLGFFVPFAQPVAKIVGELAKVKKWGVSGYVAERSLGVCGWLRCWLQIAASSDALIVLDRLADHLT